MTIITIGTTLYAASSRGDKWNPYVVTGETTQSWIVEGEKIAKATLIGRSRGDRFFTAEQRDQIDADAQYASDMRPRLGRIILVATAAQLREYAAKLGVD